MVDKAFLVDVNDLQDLCSELKNYSVRVNPGGVTITQHDGANGLNDISLYFSCGRRPFDPKGLSQKSRERIASVLARLYRIPDSLKSSPRRERTNSLLKADPSGFSRSHKNRD